MKLLSFIDFKKVNVFFNKIKNKYMNVNNKFCEYLIEYI